MLAALCLESAKLRLFMLIFQGKTPKRYLHLQGEAPKRYLHLWCC